MSEVRTPPPAGQIVAPDSAQTTVRRLILYIILFALVVVAAIGVGGLLERLLDNRASIAGGDVTGLAQSLAFTLIGGPVAVLLWRYIWKRLSDSNERSSVIWALYVSAVYAVSLITFVSSFLTAATALVDARWDPSSVAAGTAWLAVWLWHWWMARHPAKSPTRLVSIPIVAGWAYGLIVAIGGLVTALQFLVDAAIRTVTGDSSIGDPWWIPAIQSFIWAAGGALVWWWHWVRRSGASNQSGLTSVAVVVVGILGASLITIAGIGTTLFLGLRLAFDRPADLNELLSPLDTAIAGAAIGALVWSFYRGVVRTRSDASRESARLVTSGVALVATAIGVGVTVNATLAAITPALVGSDARTLLLGGISALIVGGPLWWLVWRPGRRPELSRAASIGRRVYLISVFGLSAIVAIITLLVIGFRIFEFALGDVTGASLIDRIRAPLGLLVATALVAGYHFSIWMRDRHAIIEAAPARARTIGHVYLVTGANADRQAHAIDALTGAKVTVWMRADTPAADVAEHPGPDDETLAHALDGISAAKVLVVIGQDDQIEVIPLTS